MKLSESGKKSASSALHTTAEYLKIRYTLSYNRRDMRITVIAVFRVFFDSSLRKRGAMSKPETVHHHRHIFYIINYYNIMFLFSYLFTSVCVYE